MQRSRFIFRHLNYKKSVEKFIAKHILAVRFVN